MFIKFRFRGYYLNVSTSSTIFGCPMFSLVNEPELDQFLVLNTYSHNKWTSSFHHYNHLTLIPFIIHHSPWTIMNPNLCCFNQRFPMVSRHFQGLLVGNHGFSYGHGCRNFCPRPPGRRFGPCNRGQDKRWSHQGGWRSAWALGGYGHDE